MDGKTLHLARGGPGEFKFSVCAEGGNISSNSDVVKLDSGKEFTPLMFPDGHHEVKPGKL